MTSGPRGYRALAAVAALGACAAGIAVFSGSEGTAAPGVPLAADAASGVAEKRLGECLAVERVAPDPFGPITTLERIDRWVDAGRSPVDLAPDKATALDWAGRAGARAFLGLDGARVAALLVRHPDGSHFFAGHCASVAFTDPLRRDLGGRYDAVLARLVAGI